MTPLLRVLQVPGALVENYRVSKDLWKIVVHVKQVIRVSDNEAMTPVELVRHKNIL